MSDFEKAFHRWLMQTVNEPTHFECARWARGWVENSVNEYYSDEYVQQVGSWKINQRLECQVSELSTENAKLREALEKSIKWDRKIYERYPSNTDAGAWAIESLKIKRQALTETEGE